MMGVSSVSRMVCLYHAYPYFRCFHQMSLIRWVSSGLGAIINKDNSGQAKLPVYCVSNRSCSLNFCQYVVLVGENEFNRAGFYMLF